jgi:hypothetical protein
MSSRQPKVKPKDAFARTEDGEEPRSDAEEDDGKDDDDVPEGEPAPARRSPTSGQAGSVLATTDLPTAWTILTAQKAVACSSHETVCLRIKEDAIQNWTV